MSPTKIDALRGTIDLLALKALTLQPQHGWGIGLRIRQMSRGQLEVNQGSLYPALQRLHRQGWITSEWRPSETGRQARYYKLTTQGRRVLGQEEDSWRRFVAAIDLVLRST